MKINFTKQQYKHLMRAMYFADWVTNAVCVDDEEKDKGIQEISDLCLLICQGVWV